MSIGVDSNHRTRRRPLSWGWAITVLLVALSCEEGVDANHKITSPYFLDDIVDVDARFLVTPDSTIIVSQNDSDLFQLYQYQYPYVQKPERLSSERDTFFPFFFSNQVGGMSDHYGNEKYSSTIQKLNKLIGSSTFQWIRSSPQGDYVLYQISGRSELYLTCATNLRKEVVARVQHKFHGASFSKEGRRLVISYDNCLLYYNITDHEKHEVAANFMGEKLNPFVYDSVVYFTSNTRTEFHQIFASPLGRSAHDPCLVARSVDHDLRLPKRRGDYLYYLEVVNSEYLLNRQCLTTQAVENITTQGVVYDYQFIGKDKVALSYSDFRTPRSVIVRNDKQQETVNLSNKRIDFGASYYFSAKDSLSPAYTFVPHNTARRKGIVLFFHPGLHSDFSPRWETELISLCYAGYIIVAPNYPMSTGYGKNYYNKNIGDATTDVLLWKEAITQQYQDLPLYYVSYSSGNLLMEASLTRDSEDVRSVATFFGLSTSGWADRSVPTLYVLGSNDPYINYTLRRLKLWFSGTRDKFVLGFENEGHWLRRRTNRKKAVNRTLEFFRELQESNL